jgi:hypothetical protein
MKRIFLLLLVLVLVVAPFALADPQTTYYPIQNWNKLATLLGNNVIFVQGSSNPSTIPLTDSSRTYAKVSVFYMPADYALTTTGSPSFFHIGRGFFIATAFKDSTGTIYYYVYNITGRVAYGQLSSSYTGISVATSPNSIVYYTFPYNFSITGTSQFDLVNKILADWKGNTTAGGVSTWLAFNVTADMPIIYTVTSGSYQNTISYAGGSTYYKLYFLTTSPTRINGSGIDVSITYGSYIVTGKNIYRASIYNQSTSSTNNSTDMATLTVTVNPSNYTIRFMLQGALAKQGNGTLSYQFPKNTTVTIRILNGNTQVYSIDYKLTQDTTLYFNFGNDNSIWNPTQTGSLTLQFYEANLTTGYLGKSLVVDSVQVIGLDSSVTKTASGVSQITFNDLPYGHYQVIVQKNGYSNVNLWIYFAQSELTLKIGLFPQGKAPGFIAGSESFNGTNINALNQALNQTPPSPSVSGNFYGFHFIVTDSSGNLVSAQVQILAVKSINKVLWQDTATYPLAIVNVQNGSAYWYITEEDLDRALQYAGFWESFGGFKIVSGSNSMFVPAEFARNRFYEMRIVQNQNIFGNGDVNYQGNLFGSAQTAQLIGLLFPIMIIGLIAGILKDAFKKK